jgi:hypothetical protein
MEFYGWVAMVAKCARVQFACVLEAHYICGWVGHSTSAHNYSCVLRQSKKRSPCCMHPGSINLIGSWVTIGYLEQCIYIARQPPMYLNISIINQHICCSSEHWLHYVGCVCVVVQWRCGGRYPGSPWALPCHTLEDPNNFATVIFSAG